MKSRFEDLGLKPYAEPIVASELKEDAIYYLVNFVDEEMLVPTVETVVYVGDGPDAGSHLHTAVKRRPDSVPMLGSARQRAR